MFVNADAPEGDRIGINGLGLQEYVFAFSCKRPVLRPGFYLTFQRATSYGAYWARAASNSDRAKQQASVEERGSHGEVSIQVGGF